ncbi:DUF448 domain-containing protein [Deinococcus cellulosilyticus]|uniref:YlxR domain-containing protein n=1 Tax=Deinococcus cellulosilyticus (strain DSM 18568 / NBRC 106333 / KACC 11606 / 5516J-15) TaxID=1223518 RepID=A0A511N550_DEIC1|nr:YlxR family protein [Deinococcus cellulosilyticus]GEM47974.1 hypothetical protein DC3_36090 [Deinococcus cellulosilyticus NBRC 106333 = KACC 11606]
MSFTPERTCVACRKKRPQSEMLRFRKSSEGWVMQDEDRFGRGAYVCADSPACWNEKKLRRLGRSSQRLSEQLNTRRS